MKITPVFFLLFLFASLTGIAQEESREWTSSDGKKIEGKILDLEGETITLETSRGRFELPLSRLSEEDQKFAKEWSEK